MSDLIDRQAAIKAIENEQVIQFANKDPFDDGWNAGIEAGKEAIKNLPSAEPHLVNESKGLVNKDDALRLIEQYIDKFDCIDVNFLDGLKTAMLLIRELPPAEPQIIRCKECKHWIPYDWMFSEVWQSQNIDDYPEDEIGCNWGDMAMKANDFCSRGERRTE